MSFSREGCRLDLRRCLLSWWCRITSPPQGRDIIKSRGYAVASTAVERRRTNRPYSEDELAKIVRLRREGKSLREIAAAMPDRALGSIRQKYYLTLREDTDAMIAPGPRKYSQSEISQLEQLRSQGVSWDEISRLFPGRTKMALQLTVARKARQRSSGAPWTAEEDKILLHSRNELGLSWSEIELRLPERSLSAIKMRIGEVAPAQKPRYVSSRNMNSSDVEVARRLRVGGLGWERIAGMMGNAWAQSSLYDRTRTTQRFPDGIPAPSKWTAEEDAKLLAMSESEDGWNQAEAVFGRTLRSCQSRLRALRSRQAQPRDQYKVVAEIAPAQESATDGQG